MQKLVPASTRQLRASTKTQTKSTAAIVNASKTSRKRPVKIKASEHKLTQEELLEEAGEYWTYETFVWLGRFLSCDVFILDSSDGA